MSKVIFYYCGFLSHPKKTAELMKRISLTSGIPIIEIEYHDLIESCNSSNELLSRFYNRYQKYYETDNSIFYGHSYGGTLALNVAALANKKPKKLIVSNPSIGLDTGIYRRVTNLFVPGYKPHFYAETDEEIKERIKYFTDNFSLRKYINLLGIALKTKDLAPKINMSYLYLRSGKDEMVNQRAGQNFYNSINLPELNSDLVDDNFKQRIYLPNAEHAILEEKGYQEDLDNQIGEFIRR